MDAEKALDAPPPPREDGDDGSIVFGEIFIQARFALIETSSQLLVGGQPLPEIHGRREPL